MKSGGPEKYTNHVPEPCTEEVQIVFSDEDVLVVEKPAGLLSVPGRFLKDSVLHRVMFDFPDARIVHRLDLDTSGLLVLGLSKLAISDLNRQFRERLVEKTYLARVFGELEADEGIIDLPMRADPDNRPMQVIDLERGKAALTNYRVLKKEVGTTLIELKPVTGRSHQLRLHMATIGHPILGCDLYAHEAAFSAADRLCLHASVLGFAHPETGKLLKFESAVRLPA